MRSFLLTQYIHYALYTSYALMGWGIGVIIVVSFMLSADLEHAKKVIPRPKQDADDGIPIPVKWVHHLHVSLRTRILRVHTLQEGEVQVKPWVMRLYYHDALIFKRLLDGTANEADCVQTLVYFKAEALQAARLLELRGEGAVTGMPASPTRLRRRVPRAWRRRLAQRPRFRRTKLRRIARP